MEKSRDLRQIQKKTPSHLFGVTCFKTSQTVSQRTEVFMRNVMSFTSVPKAKLAPYLPLKRKPPDPEPAEQQEKGASLRGSTSPAETSNTGVYKKICMFCKSARKHVKEVCQPLIELMSESREFAIKASIREDEEMWREYGEVNLRAKEIHYHDFCRTSFKPNKEDKGTPSRISLMYATLFTQINNAIIVNEALMTSDEIYSAFTELYQSDDKIKATVPKKRSVIRRVREHFGSKLQIHWRSRKPSIIYNSKIMPENLLFLIRNKYSKDNEPTDPRILLAAHLLKAACLEVQQNCSPLPLVLTSKHFKEGQAPVLKASYDFSLELISKDPSNPTLKEERLALSMASDQLYFATKGYVKPAKQLLLAIESKSITGSTLFGNILHRFGKQISTSKEHGILPEIAESIASKRLVVPDGLYMEPDLATTVCWDNYDELLDSIHPDKEATHDTNGAAYQNKKAIGAHPPPERATSEQEGEPPSKRRRTSYSGLNNEEVSYNHNSYLYAFIFF